MQLLGPAQIRDLAATAGVTPTKVWGQNFVHDAGTVRKIVRAAQVQPGDRVIEVGPGLGSLTLGLLEAGAHVTAVEIDPRLAEQLPATVDAFAPEARDRLVVINDDAMRVTDVGEPTALVANLPYNVAVPIILHLLASVPSLQSVLVMVQAEVADRLAAPPGSRTYGVPSVKARWYGTVRRAGTIGRAVFWPVPNVDSALVRIDKGDPVQTEATRGQVFAVVDAAFAQRRKTVRKALSVLVDNSAMLDDALGVAEVDPRARGEQLDVEDYARIASELARSGAELAVRGVT
ncbi:16S rRNA (adenine(1518)-N(6)/adenine(1519)-N(6)) -dimethyltransferase RsmA [Rarobacter faecitabidus]|uniref:Ribosomal RNA small subunit methyltransferase A n=1 Tax=Rarobacter faecitabidus TaxID=13243 RepID=A0A542ZU35_RARFA|nr:16S rRNA (adenine(1518)-N(6)/adenine(1519)-N(6))-dimethyltransferase RsmA [Rarobacter faecitabidus]TQL63799.1 dimethyladenosine transferase [Rarobacter faecitabidus]